jgi:hypothetical protein
MAGGLRIASESVALTSSHACAIAFSMAAAAFGVKGLVVAAWLVLI